MGTVRQGVTRRQFLTAAAVGATASLVAGAQQGARGADKPNVVYLFSDEHRWQSMSFTELPQVKTPNMARMASEGVHFTHCISNYPVCSPHRAMLLSGRWPYHTGVIDNNIPLSQDETTLADAFRQSGYRTGYIGKWHLGGVRAEPHGFDESLIWTGTSTHWNSALYHPADGEPVKPEGYNATLMTNQALAFIESHRDEPFFLMVSWDPPHSKFTDAPEDKKALYPGEDSLPRRPNVRPNAEGSHPNAVWNDNRWPDYQGYHAHISAIDEELGRVLAKLDELGLTGRTIVVYASDHGSMMGSHGVGSKRQPFEESIRVPFLVRDPLGGDASRGQTVDALFGSIDIAPTLCGLAGIPVPASFEGQDFSGYLRGGHKPDPESQFIMHIAKENASGGLTHPAPIFRGVRTKTHTYAVFPDGGGYLFDNERDPYQLNYLFDAPEAQATAAELRKILDAWLVQAGDPFTVTPTEGGSTA